MMILAEDQDYARPDTVYLMLSWYYLQSKNEAMFMKTLNYIQEEGRYFLSMLESVYVFICIMQ